MTIPDYGRHLDGGGHYRPITPRRKNTTQKISPGEKVELTSIDEERVEGTFWRVSKRTGEILIGRETKNRKYSILRYSQSELGVRVAHRENHGRVYMEVVR